MYESEPTRVQRGGKATNCINVWIPTDGARTLQLFPLSFGVDVALRGHRAGPVMSKPVRQH